MNVPQTQGGIVPQTKPTQVEIASGHGLSITDKSIVVWEEKWGKWVYVPKKEAIELAKIILRSYEVPFCNRIAGSGLEEKA